MRNIALIFALLATQATLYAQNPSPGSAPSVYYIGADPCWADSLNQFFLMKTGNQPYNFNVAPPQIRSVCPAGYQHGQIGAYSANPTAVSVLNTKTGGCLQRVFYDVMSAPYFGTAPANSKIMVFCNANPDVASLPPSAFAALCGPNPVLVAFGNYAGSAPFFLNRNNFPSNCGAYAEVQAVMGADNQTIQYDPNALAQQDGAYIAIETDNIVRYGVAINCAVPGLSCPAQPFVMLTGDLSLCQGERTDLTANAGPGYTYTWDNGTSGPTINVGPEITTHYIVTATSQAQPDCATAVKARVEVFTLPSDVSINVYGDSITGLSCVGDSVQLKWKFIRPVPNTYTYAWLPPKPDIILFRDKISGINEYTAGIYTLRVVFDNGCVLERAQDVGYVRPTPVVVCTNTPVCQDEWVTLEASAPGTSFAWSGPGGFSATGASHTLDSPESGDYVVTVTNNDGCTSTGSATVAFLNCLSSNTIVGNWAWKDVDRDGIQDAGEPGMANIKLYLRGDLDNDGQFDDYLDSTLTKSNGKYYFKNYPTGKYRLASQIPTGFNMTLLNKPPAPNNDDKKDNDFKFQNGEGITDISYTLAQNQVDTTIDVGFSCIFPLEGLVYSITHPTSSSAQDGAIDMMMDFGQAPYVYDWADISGNNNQEDRLNLGVGTYNITVTDNVGCAGTASITLSAPNNLVIGTKLKKSENPSYNAQKPSNTQKLITEDQIRIYPNPANTSFFVALPAPLLNCTINVVDALSRIVYTAKGSATMEIDVKNWVSGMYFVRIDVQDADQDIKPLWKPILIQH